MIRTQIMLPAKLKRALKQRAEKKELSMGELVRKYLTEKIAEDENQQSKNILLELADNAKKGGNSIDSRNFRKNYDQLSK